MNLVSGYICTLCRGTGRGRCRRRWRGCGRRSPGPRCPPPSSSCLQVAISTITKGVPIARLEVRSQRLAEREEERVRVARGQGHVLAELVKILGQGPAPAQLAVWGPDMNGNSSS